MPTPAKKQQAGQAHIAARKNDSPAWQHPTQPAQNTASLANPLKTSPMSWHRGDPIRCTLFSFRRFFHDRYHRGNSYNE